MLGKPLQRVVCTIGSFGACLEKTIEIQSIRREDAVLLFHIDTKLSPRLQSIQDSRPLSLRDLLLGHPVEGALPLRVPLRGQLPLRPHHLCLRKRLAQRFCTSQDLFWLIWSCSKPQRLDHTAPLQHRSLRCRSIHSRSVTRPGTSCHSCSFGDEILIHLCCPSLHPCIGHMVSSMRHCTVIGRKGKGEVSLIQKPPLLPPLGDAEACHSLHSSIRREGLFLRLCCLQSVDSGVVRHGCRRSRHHQDKEPT